MPEREVRKAKIEEEGGCDDTPVAAPKPKQEEHKQEDYGDDAALIPPGAPKEKGAKGHKKKQKKEVGSSDSKPSKAKGEGTHDSKDAELKAHEEKRKKRKRREEDKKVARKEKKAYDLPGQKHDTPEERDPLRIFYETLYQQLPDSEIAAVWMMEWGLLPLGEAKKVYQNKLKRNRQQKPGSPVKAAAVKKTSKASVKQRGNEIVVKCTSKTEKRKVNDDTSDDDGDDGSISAKKKIKTHSPSS